MENLGDPLGDRVMKNVPMIASEPLTRDELFITKSKISIHHSMTFLVFMAYI